MPHIISVKVAVVPLRYPPNESPSTPGSLQRAGAEAAGFASIHHKQHEYAKEIDVQKVRADRCRTRGGWWPRLPMLVTGSISSNVDSENFSIFVPAPRCEAAS